MLGIKQSLEADIKTALLGGDKKRVEILRVLKSVILDAEISEGKRQDGLTEQQLTVLLFKETKKRQDAADLYTKVGEQTRAQAELFEKDIINSYLPEQMQDSELESIIDEAIAELGETFTQPLMGKIISAVKVKSNGAADSSRIAMAVKARLG